jgi:hypothetical protein
VADFSYSDHYNLYQNGQFVKYDASVYRWQDYPPDYFSALLTTSKPVIILLDNFCPISTIELYISTLKNADLQFANASTLAGFSLTDRR